MKKINKDLEIFIINFCKEEKIISYALNNLQIETSIDLDLGIYGITMDLFLSDFVKNFNIDYSNFTWNRYGYPQDNFFIASMRLLFGYRKKWVSGVLKKIYKPKLYVFNLQKAIETGKLT
jgi:hypothetical protein